MTFGPGDVSPEMRAPMLTIGVAQYLEKATDPVAVSRAPLRGVKAVVLVYDKNHRRITWDDALIDDQPILPAKTSPFSVTGRWDSPMHTACLLFKESSVGWSMPTRTTGA